MAEVSGTSEESLNIGGGKKEGTVAEPEFKSSFSFKLSPLTIGLIFATIVIIALVILLCVFLIPGAESSSSSSSLSSSFSSSSPPVPSCEENAPIKRKISTTFGNNGTFGILNTQLSDNGQRISFQNIGPSPLFTVMVADLNTNTNTFNSNIQQVGPTGTPKGIVSSMSGSGTVIAAINYLSIIGSSTSSSILNNNVWSTFSPLTTPFIELQTERFGVATSKSGSNIAITGRKNTGPFSVFVEFYTYTGTTLSSDGLVTISSPDNQFFMAGSVALNDAGNLCAVLYRESLTVLNIVIIDRVSEGNWIIRYNKPFLTDFNVDVKAQVKIVSDSRFSFPLLLFSQIFNTVLKPRMFICAIGETQIDLVQGIIEPLAPFEFANQFSVDTTPCMTWLYIGSRQEFQGQGAIYIYKFNGTTFVKQNFQILNSIPDTFFFSDNVSVTPHNTNLISGFTDQNNTQSISLYRQ